MDVNYKMGDTVVGTAVKEKDLGVTLSADMKVSEQCGIVASNSNKILGLIRRNMNEYFISTTVIDKHNRTTFYNY